MSMEIFMRDPVVPVPRMVHMGQLRIDASSPGGARVAHRSQARAPDRGQGVGRPAPDPGVLDARAPEPRPSMLRPPATDGAAAPTVTGGRPDPETHSCRPRGAADLLALPRRGAGARVRPARSLAAGRAIHRRV